MLWFALHLPALPLEAWLAALDAAAVERPSGVIDARRVLQANAAARQAGIEPGMSAATAAALVSPAATAASSGAGLQAFARDPAREAAQVQRLALALARFTPHVVVQDDGVLLEVSASLRLFQGARALWRSVRETACVSGAASLRMAAAPTAAAAAVLARAEPASAALRRLPVAQRLDALPLPAAGQAWGIEPRLVELLHGIGCRTLGDVRVLPRTGAQRRGAAALLGAIARAHGEAPDPQRWFEWPRRFEQSLELAHRADDAAMLVFAMQRLVQPLAGWLAQQWLAAARLSLVLRHETSIRHAQPDTVVALALGDPSRDAAQITLLLRERLQRLELPAPVYAITLRLDDAVNHAGRAAALWREAGAGSSEDARALFDRLAARLGAEHVMRPQLAADHRPERAMRLVPLQAPQAPLRAQRQPVRGVPALRPAPAGRTAEGGDSPDPNRQGRGPSGARPAWLLPVPQRLQEDPVLGRPLHQGAPLALATRAERIEAGWFDGEPIRRDYHVAQAKDHRWLWVFRERRGAQQHWYLHGVFG